MATAQTKSTDSAALKQQPSTGRLVSLDAFRGAIIALMAPGEKSRRRRHVYAPLQHADWHGWTFTDVRLPVFRLDRRHRHTFSMAKRLAAGVPEYLPRRCRGLRSSKGWDCSSTPFRIRPLHAARARSLA